MTKTRKKQISALCLIYHLAKSVSWTSVLALALLTVNFSWGKPSLAKDKERIEVDEKRTLEIEDFDYWAGLCKSLKDEKKYDEAIVACNEAIEIQPKNPEIWVRRAEVLLGQVKYSDALLTSEQALRIRPQYSSALANKCQALVKLERYPEAVEACDLALLGDGNWGEDTAVIGWYYKGFAQSKLGQYREALKSYQGALEVDSQDTLSLVGACQSLSKLNRLTEAVTACDLAIKTNKNWRDSTPAIAWYNKGLAQRKIGQIEEAITSFDQALALAPKDADIWLEHGKALSAVGKVSQAVISYDFAVKLSPNYSLALAYQAANFNKLRTPESYQKALETTEKALQGDNQWGESSSAVAWEERGIALAGLGRYEEGLSSIDRAIALNPKNPETWNNRAATQWYLGRYTDALASSDRALALNPKYAQAWFNRGRILRTLQRYRDALLSYNKALDNSTNADNAELANIWANRSVVLWHLDRNREALAAADRAISLNPELSQGWYNRGVVLLELKRYSEAVTAYNRANSLTPNNPSILAGKGVALLRLGRLEEAIATFDEVLKLDSSNSIAQSSKLIAERRLQERLERLEREKPKPKPQNQGKK
ncbi:MAG TPA: tetratricopeptide repeat protein [Nostocaceae cyanobacterium]|nr:tetratricopeptide repeat protein [Nostocaceae cyanobacterium]